MSRDLQTVIELHRTLSDLRAAEELLGGIPDWMQELHAEHCEHKSEIERLEEEVAGTVQERRLAEAEINDLRETVKQHQEQIALVRNQREYSALLQEIDTAKDQIKSLEEKALEAMERQEEAETKLGENRESFQGLDSRYGAELGKWEAEKPEVAEKAQQLRGRVDVLAERLPRQLRDLFERLSTRYSGDALAPIHKVERGGRGPTMWHCRACNYRVRPQTVVLIQNESSLEFCDSCKRILYFDEATN